MNTSFCITRANKVEYFTDMPTGANECSLVNTWYILTLPKYHITGICEGTDYMFAHQRCLAGCKLNAVVLGYQLARDGSGILTVSFVQTRVNSQQWACAEGACCLVLS